MPDHGETALAWVKVMRDRDYNGAAKLTLSMDFDEMLMVITHLAALVAEQWEVECDQLGLDFDSYVREVGMWLAEQAVKP